MEDSINYSCFKIGFDTYLLGERCTEGEIERFFPHGFPKARAMTKIPAGFYQYVVRPKIDRDCALLEDKYQESSYLVGFETYPEDYRRDYGEIKSDQMALIKIPHKLVFIQGKNSYLLGTRARYIDFRQLFKLRRSRSPHLEVVKIPSLAYEEDIGLPEGHTARYLHYKNGWVSYLVGTRADQNVIEGQFSGFLMPNEAVIRITTRSP